MFPRRAFVRQSKDGRKIFANVSTQSFCSSVQGWQENLCPSVQGWQENLCQCSTQSFCSSVQGWQENLCQSSHVELLFVSPRMAGKSLPKFPRRAFVRQSKDGRKIFAKVPTQSFCSSVQGWQENLCQSSHVELLFVSPRMAGKSLPKFPRRAFVRQSKDGRKSLPFKDGRKIFANVPTQSFCSSVQGWQENLCHFSPNGRKIFANVLTQSFCSTVQGWQENLCHSSVQGWQENLCQCFHVELLFDSPRMAGKSLPKFPRRAFVRQSKDGRKIFAKVPTQSFCSSVQGWQENLCQSSHVELLFVSPRMAGKSLPKFPRRAFVRQSKDGRKIFAKVPTQSFCSSVQGWQENLCQSSHVELLFVSPRMAGKSLPKFPRRAFVRQSKDGRKIFAKVPTQSFCSSVQGWQENLCQSSHVELLFVSLRMAGKSLPKFPRRAFVRSVQGWQENLCQSSHVELLFVSPRMAGKSLPKFPRRAFVRQSKDGRKIFAKVPTQSFCSSVQGWQENLCQSSHVELLFVSPRMAGKSLPKFPRRAFVRQSKDGRKIFAKVPTQSFCSSVQGWQENLCQSSHVELLFVSPRMAGKSLPKFPRRAFVRQSKDGRKIFAKVPTQSFCSSVQGWQENLCQIRQSKDGRKIFANVSTQSFCSSVQGWQENLCQSWPLPMMAGKSCQHRAFVRQSKDGRKIFAKVPTQSFCSSVQGWQENLCQSSHVELLFVSPRMAGKSFVELLFDSPRMAGKSLPFDSPRMAGKSLPKFPHRAFVRQSKDGRKIFANQSKDGRKIFANVFRAFVRQSKDGRKIFAKVPTQSFCSSVQGWQENLCQSSHVELLFVSPRMAGKSLPKFPRRAFVRQSKDGRKIFAKVPTQSFCSSVQGWQENLCQSSHVELLFDSPRMAGKSLSKDGRKIFAKVPHRAFCSSVQGWQENLCHSSVQGWQENLCQSSQSFCSQSKDGRIVRQSKSLPFVSPRMAGKSLPKFPRRAFVRQSKDGRKIFAKVPTQSFCSSVQGWQENLCQSSHVELLFVSPRMAGKSLPKFPRRAFVRQSKDGRKIFAKVPTQSFCSSVQGWQENLCQSSHVELLFVSPRMAGKSLPKFPRRAFVRQSKDGRKIFAKVPTQSFCSSVQGWQENLCQSSHVELLFVSPRMAGKAFLCQSSHVELLFVSPRMAGKSLPKFPRRAFVRQSKDGRKIFAKVPTQSFCSSVQGWQENLCQSSHVELLFVSPRMAGKSLPKFPRRAFVRQSKDGRKIFAKVPTQSFCSSVQGWQENLCQSSHVELLFVSPRMAGKSLPKFPRRAFVRQSKDGRKIFANVSTQSFCSTVQGWQENLCQSSHVELLFVSPRMAGKSLPKFPRRAFVRQSKDGRKIFAKVPTQSFCSSVQGWQENLCQSSHVELLFVSPRMAGKSLPKFPRRAFVRQSKDGRKIFAKVPTQSFCSSVQGWQENLCQSSHVELLFVSPRMAGKSLPKFPRRAFVRQSKDGRKIFAKVPTQSFCSSVQGWQENLCQSSHVELLFVSPRMAGKSLPKFPHRAFVRQSKDGRKIFAKVPTQSFCSSVQGWQENLCQSSHIELLFVSPRMAGKSLPKFPRRAFVRQSKDGRKIFAKVPTQSFCSSVQGWQENLLPKFPRRAFVRQSKDGRKIFAKVPTQSFCSSVQGWQENLCQSSHVELLFVSPRMAGKSLPVPRMAGKSLPKFPRRAFVRQSKDGRKIFAKVPTQSFCSKDGRKIFAKVPTQSFCSSVQGWQENLCQSSHVELLFVSPRMAGKSLPKFPRRAFVRQSKDGRKIFAKVPTQSFCSSVQGWQENLCQSSHVELLFVSPRMAGKSLPKFPRRAFVRQSKDGRKIFAKVPTQSFCSSVQGWQENLCQSSHVELLFVSPRMAGKSLPKFPRRAFVRQSKDGRKIFAKVPTQSFCSSVQGWQENLCQCSHIELLFDSPRMAGKSLPFDSLRMAGKSLPMFPHRVFCSSVQGWQENLCHSSVQLWQENLCQCSYIELLFDSPRMAGKSLPFVSPRMVGKSLPMFPHRAFVRQSKDGRKIFAKVPTQSFCSSVQGWQENLCQSSHVELLFVSPRMAGKSLPKFPRRAFVPQSKDGRKIFAKVPTQSFCLSVQGWQENLCQSSHVELLFVSPRMAGKSLPKFPRRAFVHQSKDGRKIFAKVPTQSFCSSVQGWQENLCQSSHVELLFVSPRMAGKSLPKFPRRAFVRQSKDGRKIFAKVPTQSFCSSVKDGRKICAIRSRMAGKSLPKFPRRAFVRQSKDGRKIFAKVPTQSFCSSVQGWQENLCQSSHVELLFVSPRMAGKSLPKFPRRAFVRQSKDGRKIFAKVPTQSFCSSVQGWQENLCQCSHIELLFVSPRMAGKSLPFDSLRMAGKSLPMFPHRVFCSSVQGWQENLCHSKSNYGRKIFANGSYIELLFDSPRMAGKSLPFVSPRMAGKSLPMFPRRAFVRQSKDGRKIFAKVPTQSFCSSVQGWQENLCQSSHVELLFVSPRMAGKSLPKFPRRAFVRQSKDGRKIFAKVPTQSFCSSVQGWQENLCQSSHVELLFVSPRMAGKSLPKFPHRAFVRQSKDGRKIFAKVPTQSFCSSVQGWQENLCQSSHVELLFVSPRMAGKSLPKFPHRAFVRQSKDGRKIFANVSTQSFCLTV